MTEGQWLYMIAQTSIDDDEKIEGMCLKCKEESNKKRCTTCGKDVTHEILNHNPNFDENYFNKLKEKSQIND